MNIVVITSVINIPDKPFSYTSTRSIFSKDERFEQTKYTISNLRNKIPCSKILLVECSELNEEETKTLMTFFKDCLDKKKLQRVKDVSYNKDTGEIKEVPALHFNKPTIHFTLKNIDKRVSTIRSLAPKKKGTAKNVVANNDDSDSD